MGSPWWRIEGLNGAAGKKGRCAAGGALALGMVLTATPAGAHAGGPAPLRAPAQSPGSGASPLAFGMSLAIGPSFTRAKARYDDWGLGTVYGEPAPAPSFDSHSALAPGGALTLTLGGRIGSRLLVGGAIMVSLDVLSNRFIDDKKLEGTLGVGPELALVPLPQGGVFAFARGGIGILKRRAWSAAVGGGYALPLPNKVLLGLGLELRGVYSRWGEDGDFGEYTYKDEILAPALVARLML